MAGVTRYYSCMLQMVSIGFATNRIELNSIDIVGDATAAPAHWSIDAAENKITGQFDRILI